MADAVAVEVSAAVDAVVPRRRAFLTGRSGVSRVIDVTATGKRVVALPAFIKKTKKTPLKELELA